MSEAQNRTGDLPGLLLPRRSLLRVGLYGATTFLSGLAPLAAGASQAPEATTAQGRLRGQLDNGIYSFKGIRYGADTGYYRFQPPRPALAWEGVKDAFEFGPSCPQKADAGPTGEDCLCLNIWTPALRDNAKRPIMFYIHGGAYANGTGSDPRTEGAKLAQRGDVVVVTVNHRLNALGYAYLTRFTDDPRYADAGNVGQLDLIQALRWVRQHAAEFGGDPDRVMSFGQSGGGAKIATMMAMPAAKGLFQRAATMSGQQVTASGPNHATERTRAWIEKIGIKPGEIDKLASLPVEQLVNALDATDPILGGGVYFGPVLDERNLHRHPFWPDAPLQSASLPMIIGNTHDETRAFTSGRNDPRFSLNWDDLPDQLIRNLRVDIDPAYVIREYKRMFPGISASDLYFKATTAGRSWRGAVIEAQARAEQRAPTWVYQLNWQSPPEFGAFGAPHMLDIPLVFGNLDAAGSLTGHASSAQAMHAVIADAFIAHAHTGNPNHAGMPQWDIYTLPQRQTMVFDVKSHMEDDPRGEERRLFAKVPYIQPGT